MQVIIKRAGLYSVVVACTIPSHKSLKPELYPLSKKHVSAQLFSYSSNIMGTKNFHQDCEIQLSTDSSSNRAGANF